MVGGAHVKPLRSIADGVQRPFHNLRDRLSPQTRAFARDSWLLELSAAATTIALIGQLSLITHALGLREYGVFALIVSVVSLVSRFLDVPVAYTTIAFGADKVESDPRTLVGIFQFGYLVNLVSGVAGFLCVLAIAPFVGPRLIGEDGVFLLMLYAVTLVISTVDMTSLSLLRVLDRFDVTLWYTLVREASRLVLVAGALLAYHTLTSVVVALVIHDAITGALGIYLSARTLSGRTRLSLFRGNLSRVKPIRRPMLRMLFHTNIISYGRLVETQVPALALGAFWGPTEVAILKVGQSAGAALAKLTDPVWQALIPRASRLWTSGRIGVLRRMLLQATCISIPVMVAVGGVVILLREPLLTLFAGHGARAGSTVLILACLAQVVNGGLFWNIPLLYACKKAATAARLYLVNLAILVPLLLFLTKVFAANGAAAALLISTVLMNIAATLVATRLLRDPVPRVQPEGQSQSPVPPGSVLRGTR